MLVGNGPRRELEEKSEYFGKNKETYGDDIIRHMQPRRILFDPSAASFASFWVRSPFLDDVSQSARLLSFSSDFQALRDKMCLRI